MAAVAEASSAGPQLPGTHSRSEARGVCFGNVGGLVAEQGLFPQKSSGNSQTRVGVGVGFLAWQPLSKVTPSLPAGKQVAAGVGHSVTVGPVTYAGGSCDSCVAPAYK